MNKIIFPKKSEELAEFFGILFGDGYMNHYSSGHYFIEIAGHSQKDLEYHHYISKLIFNLFSLKSKLVFRKNQNTIYTRICCKELFVFLMSKGVPKGRKNILKIPIWIKKKNSYFISFIRGFFDTDGSLILRTRGQHSISIGSKCPFLINDIQKFLEKKNYFVSFEKSKDFQVVRINQKKLITRFFQEIGSSNPYKRERFVKLGEYGAAGIAGSLRHAAKNF
jgi:DNA-binding transcriptional regulator WhiA